MTPNDGQVLLRAILEDPWDDAVRLAYADSLEERGEAEWANWVRLWLASPSSSGIFTTGLGYERMPEGPAKRVIAPLAELPILGGAVNRGFVSMLHLPPAVLKSSAAEIFSVHPVVKVTLSGREPIRRRDGSFYWKGTLGGVRAGGVTGTVPMWLFHLLPDEGLIERYPSRATRSGLAIYESSEAALVALSTACVCYGRNAARLPPLPKEGEPS